MQAHVRDHHINGCDRAAGDAFLTCDFRLVGEFFFLPELGLAPPLTIWFYFNRN